MRAFPLPCPWTGIEALREICTEISSVNIQLVQSYFVAHRDKLEKVFFDDKESLHKKLSKKDVFGDYGAMADIPELAVKQYRYLT